MRGKFVRNNWIMFYIYFQSILKLIKQMKSWCLMLVCYCICIFKKSTKFKFQINETLNFLHVMRQNTQKSERRSCSQVQCFISMPQRYPKGLKLLLLTTELQQYQKYSKLFNSLNSGVFRVRRPHLEADKGFVLLMIVLPPIFLLGLLIPSWILVTINAAKMYKQTTCKYRR